MAFGMGGALGRGVALGMDVEVALGVAVALVLAMAMAKSKCKVSTNQNPRLSYQKSSRPMSYCTKIQRGWDKKLCFET